MYYHCFHHVGFVLDINEIDKLEKKIIIEIMFSSDFD